MGTEPETISQANLYEALIPRIHALHEQVERRIPHRYRNTISADDILQEVWVAAFRKLPDFDSDDAHAIDRWLTTIASRKLVDALRSARQLKRGGDRRLVRDAQKRLSSCSQLFARLRSPGKTPSKEAHLREAQHTIMILLNGLNDDRRQAMKLRYFGGLSNKEIAREMGRTKAAVNSLLFRAQRQLRDLLGSATDYFSDARSSDAH